MAGERGVSVTQFIAKVFLAGGFLLGVSGLMQESTVLLRSGLGMIAAGMVAAGYNIYRMLVARWQQPEE
ncbi:MAG: hypothetical protein ACE5MM_07385 [Nitrospiraceae bacterium]